MGDNWGFIRPEWLWTELLVALAIALFWRGEVVRKRRLLKLVSVDAWRGMRGLVRRRRRAYALMSAALALAGVAMAGPFWGQRFGKLEAAGVNVICVVDVSASMNARDYTPSRLEVARLELGRLLKRLKGQRVGIVGFAGIPVTLLPITVDYTAAEMALDNLSTSSIPLPGTAIGDGIRVALERLEGAGGVLVLMSDGEDHHSDPLQAAKEAAKRGVPIVCVGIGTERGDNVPVRDAEGKGDVPLRDETGQIVTSRLDVRTMREIASLTKGVYFRLEAGNERNLEAIMAVVRSCQAKEQARQEAKMLNDCGLYVAGISLTLLLGALWMYGSGSKNGIEV